MSKSLKNPWVFEAFSICQNGMKQYQANSRKSTGTTLDTPCSTMVMP